ncbi:hypothetical protein F5Y17DRAFT_436008 [Xylariaceae sp. FL0594]|nr:hypothetical protein F5Y17DRAFT_436008 [Xylariaceae sp. FL0594]
MYVPSNLSATLGSMTPRFLYSPRLPAVHNQVRDLSSVFQRKRSIHPRDLPTAPPLLSRLYIAGPAHGVSHWQSRTGKYLQPVDIGRNTRHNLTTTAAKGMASDDDYMAFLNKANQDPNDGFAKPQSSGEEFKTTDNGADIPAVLKEATRDAFYVSDADEPFVSVCLAWNEGGKGLPDEEEFASLIHHPSPSDAEIEIQDPADWDTQGQYQAVIDAVTKAGKGNDVRVYRVPKGGVKVEYWVVTTDGKGAGARLVGAKALAVES